MNLLSILQKSGLNGIVRFLKKRVTFAWFLDADGIFIEINVLYFVGRYHCVARNGQVVYISTNNCTLNWASCLGFNPLKELVIASLVCIEWGLQFGVVDTSVLNLSNKLFCFHLF